MTDRDDEDQRHIDEEASRLTPGRSSPLRPDDELALYAFVHSALRDDPERSAGSTRIEAIEDRIRAIERGGLHAVEVAVASVAMLIAALIAVPIVVTALGSLAERTTFDAGTVAVLVAAGAAAALVTGASRAGR